MNLKISFKWVLICLYPFLARAQKISPGDTLPDLYLSNVINYRSNQLKLSDLRGKAVILDFWNHHCISCIKAFPKLDSLQKIFKDKVQIILVNSESNVSTLNFFKKRPNIKFPDLVMITEDSVLSAFFPAEGYPYSVWIDGAGVIRHFSGSHVITTSTISMFLSGNKQTFPDPTKKRVGSPVDFSDFQYFSYISPCNDKLYIGNAERIYTPDSAYVHLSSNCASVLELFTKAYGEKGTYNFNTSYGVDLRIADSSKYLKPVTSELLDSWSAKYGYNYELYLPASKSEKAYKTMQEDLERHFPVKAYVKTKQVNGVVLVADDTTKLISRGETPINSFNTVGFGEKTREYRFFTNQPFSQLQEHLRLWIQYYYPFRSNVNLSNNIDIRIREKSVNPLNIHFLNEDLRKYGLRLIFLELTVPVLHIEELQ